MLSLSKHEDRTAPQPLRRGRLSHAEPRRRGAERSGNAVASPAAPRESFDLSASPTSKPTWRRLRLLRRRHPLAEGAHGAALVVVDEGRGLEEVEGDLEADLA